MMNTNQFKAAMRTTLSAMLVSTLLASCDSGSVGSGTPQPSSEEQRSTPESSLTFAQQEQPHAQPGASALQSTLGAAVDDALTFEELQTLVFGPMCSGCHSGGGLTQPSVYDFTNADSSHATLTGSSASSAALVTAGNSSNSPLIASLQGNGVPLMPMRAAPVSDELMTAISGWIDSGAAR